MGPISTRTSSVSRRGRVAAVLLAAGVAFVALRAVSGQEVSGDGNRLIGDAKCFVCHQEHKEAFAKSIHAELLNREDKAGCESCHGAGFTHASEMGGLESIVRFEKLTPRESSERCLSCHGDATSGHLANFLESKYLAAGTGCIGCHEAHAPAAEAAAAPKKQEITSDSCLLCHSDRPEMVEFSHKEQVADLGGCIVCHGKGEEHVLSRGAPGTMKGMADLDGAQADKACVLCHSDLKEGHFEPAPGKERCIDCHTVHTPPEIVAPEPEPTPGKPALDLGGEEGRTEPEQKPFPMYSLPPIDDEQGEEALGALWSGDMRIGYRFVSVDGDKKLYDQDVNLDQGFRLFDFQLDGVVPGEEETQIRLVANGIHDPVEDYLVDIRHGNDWRLRAKAMHTNFVYHATGDPWDQSSKRWNMNSELVIAPEAPLRFTLGYDLWHREGNRLGTRWYSGAVRDTDEPFEELAQEVYLRIDWDIAPEATLTVKQGYRWEYRDHAIADRDPSPASLELDQRTDVSAPVTTALARWTPAKEWVFDGKLVWSPISTDTDVRSRTTGTTSGGFEELVLGDVNGDRNFLRTEIGGTYYPDPDWFITARFEGMQNLERTDGTFDNSVRTSATAPTVDSTTADVSDRDHRRWRLQGEAGWRPEEWGAFRLGYEYMWEEFDREFNGVTDFHDGNYSGPYVGIDLDPSEDWAIDFEYHHMRSSDPFTEISPRDRSDFDLRVRFTGVEGLSLTGHLKERLTTNPRHDTEVDAWNAGLGLFWTPDDDWSIQARYDYMKYDSSTDVVEYIGGIPINTSAEYDGRTNGVTLTVTYRVSPELRFWANGVWFRTAGTFPSDVMDADIGGEYFFSKNFGVGADLRYVEYDDDVPLDEYDGLIFDLWLRVRF